MIPVLMFHSVGNENAGWSRKSLSSPLAHFDYFCRFIKKTDYKSIFFDEWYSDNRFHTDVRDVNKIVLTFDDGYLDNWVFVFPLLKKYGLNATIFINPEFVDPSSTPRLNLEDVWNGRIGFSDLHTVGFLNWAEMKTMEQSGLIDIQSHSMSHNKYYYEKNIIDIYTEENMDHDSVRKKYEWIPWLSDIYEKPFCLLDRYHVKLPLGLPIYQNDRALAIRRYFPHQDEINFSIWYTRKLKKTKVNLQQKDKYEIISNIYKYRKLNNLIGTYETDKEQYSRYLYELLESKKLIENNLKKIVKYLCWPGGGYNELSIRISENIGYIASTIKKKEPVPDSNFNNNYKRIKRIGMSSVAIHNTKNIYHIKSKRALVDCFYENYNPPIFKNLYRYKRILKYGYYRYCIGPN